MTRELAGLSSLYRRGRAASSSGGGGGGGGAGAGAPASLQGEEGGEQREATEADLRLAQQRLHRFGAVLVLERWEASMELMAGVYGWRELDAAKHRAGSRRRGRRRVECEEQNAGWGLGGESEGVANQAGFVWDGCRDSQAEVELAAQPEALALLRRRNRLDLALYAYAVRLHESQRRLLGGSSPGPERKKRVMRSSWDEAIQAEFKTN